MATSNPIEGTVIHGTLRLEDLLPAFLNAAKVMLGEDGQLRYYRLLDRFHELDPLSRGRGRDLIAQGRLDAAEDLLDDLFDLLTELAPEGYYFGPHPGDGSDFGYWQEEDED